MKMLVYRAELEVSAENGLRNALANKGLKLCFKIIFPFVRFWDFFGSLVSQILGDSPRSFIEVPRISKLFFRFSIPAKYLSASLLRGSDVFRGCSDAGAPRPPRLSEGLGSPGGSVWFRDSTQRIIILVASKVSKKLFFWNENCR